VNKLQRDWNGRWENPGKKRPIAGAGVAAAHRYCTASRFRSGLEIAISPSLLLCAMAADEVVDDPLVAVGETPWRWRRGNDSRLPSFSESIRVSHHFKISNAVTNGLLTASQKLCVRVG
jgi:hypothetical protein